MNLLKQSIRLFSSKLIINLIIVLLLSLTSIAIMDGLIGVPSLKNSLKGEKQCKGLENMLYIRNVSYTDNSPVDISNLSYSPNVHRVGNVGLKIEESNKKLAIDFLDETLLSMSTVRLIEGRMPSATSSMIEFIAPEGVYKLGEEFAIKHKNFQTAKVVGICALNDETIYLSGASNKIMSSTELYRKVYYDSDIYTLYSVYREDIELIYYRNALLIYDKDTYKNKRTAIWNEFSAQGMVATSIGELYNELESSVGVLINKTIILTLCLGIPALVMLLIVYHSIFLAKANTIGVYYMIGYSKKKISEIMIMLSLLYLIIFMLLTSIAVIFLGGAIYIEHIIIALTTGFVFNGIGLAYILIMLNRKKTKIVNLVKQEE